MAGYKRYFESVILFRKAIIGRLKSQAIVVEGDKIFLKAANSNLNRRLLSGTVCWEVVCTVL